MKTTTFSVAHLPDRLARMQHVRERVVEVLREEGMQRHPHAHGEALLVAAVAQLLVALSRAQRAGEVMAEAEDEEVGVTDGALAEDLFARTVCNVWGTCGVRVGI